jgi:hypothetical protein
MTDKRKSKHGRKGLTAGEQKAVEERVKDDCNTNVEAYKRAYPKAVNWKPATVRRASCTLFNKPRVKEALEKEREKIRSVVRKKIAITAERIIEEFTALATSSISDIMQYEIKKGPSDVKIYVMKMTEFDKLTDETKRAIKKIKARAIPKVNSEGETEHIVQEVEFEMYDKQRALDSLAKHHQLYVEKVDVHHHGTVGVVHTTVQELRTLFESMTPQEREKHMNKLIKEIEDV